MRFHCEFEENSIFHSLEKSKMNYSSLDNVTHSLNKTICKYDDFCTKEEFEKYFWESYIFPKLFEWLLIVLHCVVFVVGLVGNFLVCLAVYRNQSMRTVTNLFIVNLAIADFLVILLCLPPTVLWDVTETWFMGSLLCKVILYFQTVSVSVSVLTLTFISVDRWYAICHPLQFRSTIGRAKTAITVIWVISLLIDIPELVILDTRPLLDIPFNTTYLSNCAPTWESDSELIYQVVKLILLYILPLLFVSVTYYQIVRVLWRSAHFVIFNQQQQQTTDDGNNGAASLMEGNTPDMMSINSNASTLMQLRSRRKAAKMLVVIVIVFAICYFPVHLLSLLRNLVDVPQNDYTVAVSMISHWLCYFNSAINPVIYNFMSGKFRKEFRRVFRCRCRISGDNTPMSMCALPSVAVVLPAATGAALAASLTTPAAAATVAVFHDSVPAQVFSFRPSGPNAIARSRSFSTVESTPS